MKKLAIGIILLLVVVIIISSLDFGKSTVSEEVEKTQVDTSILNAIDSMKHDMNSLVSCTADTILSVNPELVVLLDPLYQLVRNDSVPMTIQEKEKWMSDFRLKLSAYYDAHQLGSDALNNYEKADSVMSVAEQLYEMDEDWSTMGMVVRNSINYTFNVFREYNLLSQMLARCDDDKKNLVYQEWAFYEDMSETMCDITTELVFLDNWGGSICGPLCTIRHLELSNARRTMYSNLLRIQKGESCTISNVEPLNHTVTLFFDSLYFAFKDAVKQNNETWEDAKSINDPDYRKHLEEDMQMYNETIKETESYLLLMRPKVKKWASLWNKLDGEITAEGNRHHAERIASAMLSEWAGTASSKLISD